MAQQLGIGKIVLILLLVSIGFTSVAQPQDNTVVSTHNLVKPFIARAGQVGESQVICLTLVTRF